MQHGNSNVHDSAPTPKPTKYRLACDSCQQSKIRCDQERPTCRRCAKKGMKCVYSPARRAGRPRTRNISKNPCSCSNTSNIPIPTQPIPDPAIDDLDLSSYQQSDDNFMQALHDFTDSQGGDPKESLGCYMSMSPEYEVAPGLLDIGICGAPRGQNQHQQRQEHEQPIPVPVFLDEEPLYFGFPSLEDHQICQISDQHQEHESMATLSVDNVDVACLQTQPQVSQPSDYLHFSTGECKCVSTILDYLSTPASGLSSSFAASALSTTRILITCCFTAMGCPNGCPTRPSTALAICEAIDRALLSLKLGSTSLWSLTMVPSSSYEKEARSLSSSPSSLSSTSGGSSNETLVSSPEADPGHEHEILHCGSLPIRGADKRAVLRVLQTKRLLEMQRVLERLRETLLSLIVR
ncbi:hypothetical protein C7974DRAFT_405234 [Boeremia exigua]|uniref:uncharacterized protein n=1 Tax=Boeremia exigua TaxID=749465 RepID=UPI001E8DA363|nr:uncharacterized protein C7974DRAFT_405234 [Boeremia exigua]KAH6613144.1 hypothetical protein C7974DRAFT_405234 [Boeremia exigua]